MSITLFVTIQQTYCIFTPSSLKASAQSLVHNIVRNFQKAFVEHSAKFHIGIFNQQNQIRKIPYTIARKYWCILNPFSLIYYRSF